MVHEWALAESIVMYLVNQGIKRSKNITVKVGALQSLDKEILAFAIKELSREHGLEVGDVVVSEEDPVLKCRVCGYTWTLKPAEMENHVREAIHFLPEAVYAYFKCPNCGSVDFEVLKGRGLSEVLVEGYE